MVEVFNHVQGSDNLAVVTDHGKENAANLAVGSWKDREKMSVNKAAPGEAGTKSLEFDDIYKKGGKANLADGDTNLKKHQAGELKDQEGKPNVAGADTTIKKVPQDGGLKEPMGKPNAADGDTAVSKVPQDGGLKNFPNKKGSDSGIAKDKEGQIFFYPDQESVSKEKAIQK